MKGLTAKQRNVLDFLKEFIENEGYPPSLRDICAFFTIKAPKNARKHLIALEKKGFIKRNPGSARAIEVVEPSGGGSGGGASERDSFPAGAGGRTVPIPILGRVRAGMPHLAVEDIDGYLRLDSDYFNTTGTFILRAEGESMKGAGIDCGDHLIVRPGRAAETGEIVIAMIDGEATVKRFSSKDGRISLLPENPAFDKIEVDRSRDFSIIGRVVNVIKSV